MAIIILSVFVASLLTATLSYAICCESIKGLVDKKIEANKTLCAAGSTLSLNCCKDIAQDVENHIMAYETFCSNKTPGK